MNRETAITQYGLSATNQRTPYGSLSYKQIGTWPDGTPRYESTQDFSPDQQRLYDSYTKGQQQFGDIANTQLGRVASALSSPFDFKAAQANELSDIQRTFLDPIWEKNREAAETQFFNRGMRPGSEAYDKGMKDFSTQRDRAYNAMHLDAYDRAAQMALTERNQPLAEVNALLTGSQPTQPNFVGTPNVPVQPTDYAGLVSNNYQQQMAGHNAMMGGLFGLAAAPLGGWARGGFKFA